MGTFRVAGAQVTLDRYIVNVVRNVDDPPAAGSHALWLTQTYKHVYIYTYEPRRLS